MTASSESDTLDACLSLLCGSGVMWSLCCMLHISMVQFDGCPVHVFCMLERHEAALASHIGVASSVVRQLLNVINPNRSVLLLHI